MFTKFSNLRPSWTNRNKEQNGKNPAWCRANRFSLWFLSTAHESEEIFCPLFINANLSKQTDAALRWMFCRVRGMFRRRGRDKKKQGLKSSVDFWLTHVFFTCSHLSKKNNFKFLGKYFFILKYKMRLQYKQFFFLLLSYY